MAGVEDNACFVYVSSRRISGSTKCVPFNLSRKRSAALSLASIVTICGLLELSNVTPGSDVTASSADCSGAAGVRQVVTKKRGMQIPRCFAECYTVGKPRPSNFTGKPNDLLCCAKSSDARLVRETSRAIAL